MMTKLNNEMAAYYAFTSKKIEARLRRESSPRDCYLWDPYWTEEKELRLLALAKHLTKKYGVAELYALVKEDQDVVS